MPLRYKEGFGSYPYYSGTINGHSVCIDDSPVHTATVDGVDLTYGASIELWEMLKGERESALELYFEEQKEQKEKDKKIVRDLLS